MPMPFDTSWSLFSSRLELSVAGRATDRWLGAAPVRAVREADAAGVADVLEPDRRQVTVAAARDNRERLRRVG